MVSHHILSRAQAPGLAKVVPGRNFGYGVPPPLRFLPYSWKASFIEEPGVRGGLILFLFTKEWEWVLMSCTCYVLRGLSTRRRDNRKGPEAVRTSSERRLARN